jgi:hypothetical protein
MTLIHKNKYIFRIVDLFLTTLLPFFYYYFLAIFKHFDKFPNFAIP